MKLSLPLFFIFITTISYSQIQKKEMQLSLQFAPYITNQNNNIENSTDVGYIGIINFELFISKNISVSTGFFTSNNTLFKNESGTTINSYGILPSAQYYFINKKKFTIFGTVGYGFGFEDLTRLNIQNSAITIFDIGVGGNFWVSDKFSIKLTIPYFYSKNITINRKAVEGVTPFFGVNYKI